MLVDVNTKREKSKPTLPSENQLHNKFEQITSSVDSNEPLRLKRPKPLKRDVSNLETSLGIVRKKK